MKLFCLTAMASALSCALAAGPVLGQSEPRAVVELFTSQGCSSCPPADKVLGELAKDPSIIALSMSVDYWDYLGWKDTLALRGHSQRQRGYASARGDREVYTPQAVINGKTHVIGSNRAELEKAVRAEDAHLPLPVMIGMEAGGLHIGIKPKPAAASVGDIWLCLITREASVKIAKGENRGKEITYHNVVRRWIKVGTWDGEKKSWTVPRSEFERDDPDAVAVLVQSGSPENPGMMLGAAMLALR